MGYHGVVPDSTPAAEWDARTYHRLSAPQVEWGRAVLARLFLSGDERVIDAGCGTGRLTGELLDRLPRGSVLAIDRSENMIVLARQYLMARFEGRLGFVRADLAALPVRGWADVVFSTATFHWVLDHPRLFRGLLLALRPGGRLEAQCGGGPNLARLLRRASVLAASSRFAAYFAGWVDPWEFADAAVTADRLRAAGFIEVETSLESAPVTLSNADEYREFLSCVVVRAHLERLPPHRRLDFAAALAEQAARDDPPFVLDYWRLNLRGLRPKAGHGD